MLLNDELVEELQRLRSIKSPEFFQLILTIRKAGWTFEAIAQSMNVTRSAAFLWHKKAESKGYRPSIILVNPPEPSLIGKAKKIKRRIPPQDAEKIKNLAAVAGKNTGAGTYQSESDELNRYIKYYVVDRNVSASEFARVSGLSRTSIHYRVKKVVE